MTVFSGVLSGMLLWQLLGLLTVLSSKSGKFNPFLDPSLNDISSHTLDQCFCDVNTVNVVLASCLICTQLKGQVDVCCCDVETINNLNRNYILPVISKLVTFTFFKIFRVS